MVQPEHGLVDDEADDDGCDEEEDGVQQHIDEAGVCAAAGTQHTGEHHDADDIINDGCADDGGAEEALELAQLLQGGDGDGDAGGRHDGADEERPIKLRAAQRRKAVEQAVEQGAACQRHGHAHAGDEGSDGTGPHQLLKVGAEAGGEHQQHDAYLSKNGDGVAGLDEVQQTGTDDKTCDDLAHHLRRPAFAGEQREELGADEDEGEIPKDGIHRRSFL